ncbi:MAG: T9SS type A sorting domain-containing protein, partial [Ignavibacteriota bacterium]
NATTGFQFPVNGSGAMQNLIRNPVQVSVPSAQRVTFKLDQNRPNPFSGLTTMQFALTEGGRVLLEVYDARGSLISTPANGYYGRGSNQITFDGRNLATGTYYCRLEVGGNVETRQMLLVK